MTTTRLHDRILRWPIRIAAICLATAISACGESQTTPTPSYEVCGIDISAHNGDIDFEAVRGDSVDFVIIKATEGATFKDPMFAVNIANAMQAGLKVGAYHFFRFETNGMMQALNLLNSVRGRKLDLPLIVDVEEWGNPVEASTADILGRVREMTDILESNGYPVMIYTNRDGYERFINNQLERYPIWICSFSDPPLPEGSDAAIWQYSHDGKVSGVKGNVDRNVYMGTRDQFDQWLESLTFAPQYYE